MDSSTSTDPHCEGNFLCLCDVYLDCPNRSECELRLGSHRYTDLVDKIVRYAEGPIPFYHPRQIEAHREAVVYKDIYRFRSDNLSIHCLQKYARIFDDFFFFGALHRNNRLRVNWCPELAEKEEAYGQTIVRSDCVLHQEIHAVEILIYPTPCEDVDGSLHSSILTALLHELCHAVLMLYGCKRIMTARTYVLCYGLTGHGLEFLKLYTAILHEAKHTFGINYREDAFSASRQLEQTALEEALRWPGVTLSDIANMDSASLETAIGRTPGNTPGLAIHWQSTRLPRRRSWRSRNT